MANVVLTASIVSTITGAPMSTVGTGAALSITTAGTDVIQSTQDVTTSYAAPDFGAITFPALVLIQHTGTTDGSTASTESITISTDGTTDSKISVPPTYKILLYLTSKTNFKWKSNGASNIKAFIGAVEIA